MCRSESKINGIGIYNFLKFFFLLHTIRKYSYNEILSHGTAYNVLFSCRLGWSAHSYCYFCKRVFQVLGLRNKSPENPGVTPVRYIRHDSWIMMPYESRQICFVTHGAELYLIKVQGFKEDFVIYIPWWSFTNRDAGLAKWFFAIGEALKL